MSGLYEVFRSPFSLMLRKFTDDAGSRGSLSLGRYCAMNRTQVRFLMMLATLLLALPGFAQTKKRNKAASFDGTTGLFRTWDAETLKKGELNFTIGWSHWNRDPGQLRFQSLSEGGAIGIADRFEFFASFDALKRIRA